MADGAPVPEEHQHRRLASRKPAHRLIRLRSAVRPRTKAPIPRVRGGPFLVLLVPRLVKRPTPMTIAARTPMKMNARRRFGAASGAGESPVEVVVTDSMNVIADQHVARHGDEQHRQVRDGVAEHPHGVFPGHQLLGEPGSRGEWS